MLSLTGTYSKRAVRSNRVSKCARRLCTASEPSDAVKHSKLHEGIQRDLKRGNMWEYAQMKRHPDGKVWAGRELLAEQNVMWPSALNTVKGKGVVSRKQVDLEAMFSGNAASFVLVTQKRPFAVQQIDSWTLPLRDTHPTLPIVDLTVSQNLGYWWLNPMLSFLWSAQDRVQATFGYSYISPLTNLTQQEFGIDIENGFFNYQFLVDSNCKIRWQSVGQASDNELLRVNSMVKRLTNEFSTTQKTKL